MTTSTKCNVTESFCRHDSSPAFQLKWVVCSYYVLFKTRCKGASRAGMVTTDNANPGISVFQKSWGQPHFGHGEIGAEEYQAGVLEAEGMAVPQDRLGCLRDSGFIMQHEAGEHAIGAFHAPSGREDQHLGRLSAPRP
jgi:hypothetical protein